ncbi:hypothetical protein [Daejeonella lutea]|uniref:Uncharacterized protein n=1 Tax=Daejeonella lutea TaxID=572036 RepID=A0A1T5B1L8_9SPHI|nr:hypothetical protein [Daejeonella lutea]SKB41122.1 hypothetical protein SAMN05661099_1204 [Daejeonella lutea]
MLNHPDKPSNRGRQAMYSLSARANLIVRYLPDDPEWPLTKLEAFENRQLAKELLIRIREMLVKLSKLTAARSRSTHKLLRTAVDGKVIDTYPGQQVSLSDLILATGKWPVSDVYNMTMGVDKFMEIQWDPKPGAGESEDDELVILFADFFDGQVWVWAQRGIPRGAGSFAVNCAAVDRAGEINCWMTFKSATRIGEYSELRYAGWVSFSD